MEDREREGEPEPVGVGREEGEEKFPPELGEEEWEGVEVRDPVEEALEEVDGGTLPVGVTEREDAREGVLETLGEAVEVEETLPVKVTVLVLLAACVALPAGGVGVLLGVVSGDAVSVREPVEVAQAVRTEEGEPSG